MYNCFTRINPIVKALAFAGFILLGCISNNAQAQTKSFGDPIINITFGAGSNKFAGPLNPGLGTTTYTYSSSSPDDNYYTIVNTSAQTNNGWVTTTDHTGNAGGYFMIVNASYTPGIFYTNTITNLCGGTTYQFGAWIKNLIRGSGGIKPNVTFSIEKTDGTVINATSTGDIANGTDSWIPYDFTFTTPNNSDPIVLKMINNAPGGGGNDIAIDDITFRPQGAPVAVTFGSSTTSSTTCEGTPITLVMNASTTLPPGYLQKPQRQTAGVWADIGPASTANSFTVTTPTAAGGYRYRLVSGETGNIGSSQCVVASNELNVYVVALPSPTIKVLPIGCIGAGVEFDVNMASTGDTFLWNFGDGKTSTEKKPKHIYTAAGDYTVSLTLTTVNNCVVQAPSVLPVHISKLPTANFTYSNPDCATRAVTFTDISTTTESQLNISNWDFDDGTTSGNQPANQSIQHTFSSAGTYNVKLVTETNFGCTDTKIISVVVHPNPVAGFTTPPSCVSDFVTFTNTSTIADGTQSLLTYKWDFDDGSPIQTTPNGTHRFTQAKEYNIKLIVTSNNGCTETLIQKFRVNGGNPVAGFEVIGGADHCSGREVLITNKSNMNGAFGDITKVEVYFIPLNGQAGAPDVYNYPQVGQVFSHTFPEFHNGADQQYQVRVIAYSGSACFDVAQPYFIKVQPTPILEFNLPVTEICENAGPLILTSADRSGAGINGTAVYTGKGVSASGVFDPAAAGLGLATIQCIYTYNSSACADTITRQILVKPVPTVSAGADVSVLEGGTVMLDGRATGTGLTYQWSPVTGLSDPAIANPIVTGGPADMVYTLTVTNDKGCAVSDSVKVTSLKYPVIPNTFTPNGDGINDFWEIKNLNTYRNCTVDIFNRYGQKVFSSVGYAVPWDGRLGNSDLATGVYYYILNPKNGRKTTTGYITIIR